MVEEKFIVRYHEMGPDRSIPLWVLQNYFQQAAAVDAQNLSYGWEDLAANGVGWVLIKIQFKIIGKIEGVQTLKVKTWHCYSDKMQSRRDFIIYDEAGREAVKGTSQWLVLDLAKRKITRTPQALLESKGPAPVDIETDTQKTPSFEGKTPAAETKIIARFEDLDVNDHVNNVHFTAWALESVPESVRKNKKLGYISVNFKAETKAGEALSAQSFEAEQNAFWHILKRENDGKEIATAYSVWEEF